jgi:hypothetical protein
MAESGLGMQTVLARSASPEATTALRAVKDDQVRALRTHLDGTLEKLGGTRDSGAAGSRIAESYNRFVELFQKKIAQEVGPEFDKAMAAGADQIPTARIRNAFETLIEQNSTEIATESGKTSAKSLKALLEGIGETTSVKSLQNALRQWGSAARGQGLAIADIQDKAFQRGVARKIFGALNKTLSEAAESPGVNAEAAAALRVARQKYAQGMAEQAKNDSAILRQIVKAEANLGQDASIEGILTAGPSAAQIRRAVNVLGKADGLALRDFQTAALGSFLEKADTPQKLITALSSPKNQRKIVALLGGDARSGEVIRRLGDAMAYATRITAQGTATGKSPTAPMQMAMGAIKSIPVVGSVAEDLVRFIAPLSDPGKLAAALINPEARQLLFRATRPGITGNALRSIQPRLAAAIGAEQNIFGRSAE